jgi:hypothetical protein
MPLQPLPASLLGSVCEHKVKHDTKEVTKFFERHLTQRQCQQVSSSASYEVVAVMFKNTNLLQSSRNLLHHYVPSDTQFMHVALQIWAMLAHYHGKLVRTLDTPYLRYGGAWEKMLDATARKAAANRA